MMRHFLLRWCNFYVIVWIPALHVCRQADQIAGMVNSVDHLTAIGRFLYYE